MPKGPSSRLRCTAAAIALASTAGFALPAAAQEETKPNILFIMGDDIGYMQP